MGGANRICRASRRRHRPKKLGQVTHCSNPLRLCRSGRTSANPLQGIQVINSVNPCSSTPLHRPIYPYHYRGFLVLLRPRRLYSPPAPTLSSLARSSSFHPTYLESRFTSPRLDSPSATTPGKSRKLRLQRLSWHTPRRAAPFPSYVLSPPFYRTFLLLPSSRLLLTARNLPAVPFFYPLFCPPLAAVLFHSFLYFSSFPVLSWSFPPAVSRSSSARGGLLLGLKL